MFYTVFSTNDNPYMQWQSDLLEYSWKRVGQEGELIRLVATDKPQNLPTQKHARCVATRLWDVHAETGDAYPIYNKPASLLEWVFRERPEGTVLLLDPDCIFRKPVDRRVAPGFPASQAWVNFSTQNPGAKNPFGIGNAFSFLADHCLKTDIRIDPVMIPTLVHTRDLRKICARWLELCGIIRDKYRNAAGVPIWEADMYAYLAACAEYDLQHEPISLGVCTNWGPDDAADAPLIHYCQPIMGKDGVEQFNKYHYKPWALVDSPVEPLHWYGAELITIVNSFIYDRTGTDRPLSRSDVPVWNQGVMEGRVLDEMLLEQPADGSSIWMNVSGIAVWNLCDGSHSIGEIAERLSEEYSVAEHDLVSDVFAIINQLREIGYLRFA